MFLHLAKKMTIAVDATNKNTLARIRDRREGQSRLQNEGLDRTGIPENFNRDPFATNL